MRKYFILFPLLLWLALSLPSSAGAQCSICTRTAQQMGAKPAQGLNSGIMYLAAAPMLILGIIGYIFWRRNKAQEEVVD